MKISVNGLMMLILVFIASMYALGFFKPLNNKYEEEYKLYMKESQAVVDSLESHITFLTIENDLLQLRADSALAQIEVEEEKRKQERDAFNRKIARLNKLTPSELSSYFAERYGK